MNKNIVDELKATETEFHELLRKFLPVNQSKFWLETNNAQRQMIHEKFIEYKKMVARAVINSISETDPVAENNIEDWSKNFKL